MLCHLYAILEQNSLKSGLSHVTLALGEGLILLQTAVNVFPFVGEFLAEALLVIHQVLGNATGCVRCDRVGTGVEL